MLSARYVYVKPDFNLVICAALAQGRQASLSHNSNLFSQLGAGCFSQLEAGNLTNS